MLNKKEKQIIQCLIKSKEEFVTSKELAEYVKCTDRTIRTYYKVLLEKLENYPKINLISKQGHGYKLEILDNDAFAQFLEENHINTEYVDSQSVSDINDRYNYLLNKLLFEQNEIYFDDLADELFVSRSTLSSDFKKIRQKFKPYHLKVESKANKGVYVTGLERDKRRFIMDYFISSGFINSVNSYVDNELLNQKIPFGELTLIVLDECREGELKLSDFVIQNLVIHIALAIRRIAEGFQINKFEYDKINIRNVPEREISIRILKRVSHVTGIDFPSEEIDYITLHLISKRQGDIHYISQEQKNQMRQELLDSISKFNKEGKNDFQLIEGLMTHLSTMIVRLEGQIVLENPLTKQIIESYADMYHLAQQVICHMPMFRSYALSEDEIAYIALHFMAARERFKDEKKYNVLVICATGYGSAQMLKSRIENEFKNLISISEVVGYYEINEEKIKNVDFIVSSIDLSNLNLEIPVFTTSVFLTEDEVQKINNGIARMEASKSVENVGWQNTTQSLDTLFDAYFDEEFFFIQDDCSKDEVLRKLAQKLSIDEDDTFESQLLDLIEQRESMGSVVFSDGIAVPHPLKAVGNNHRFAVALVKKGLYWDDEHPSIKLVFLMSMSIHENDGLPELTSQIVDLIDDQERQDEILSCQSFDKFRTLFLKK